MAAGVTSMTGSRTDPRASYAAFRFGADPSGSHQHFDGGDFDFQALGQEWAVDLGMETGTYDLLAEDRSSTRLNYYRTRAEGHNTLAIDPFDPTAGKKTGTTQLVSRGADVDSAYAVADLSAAYPDEVSSWKRGVRLFDNRSQLLSRTRSPRTARSRRSGRCTPAPRSRSPRTAARPSCSRTVSASWPASSPPAT